MNLALAIICCLSLINPILGMQSLSRDEESLETELFDLANNGNAGQLRAFLDEHPELINARSKKVFKGYTALHFACLRGDEETSALLIDRGASLYVEGDCNGKATSLMLAAKKGSEAICRKIFEKDPAISHTGQATKATKNSAQNGHTDLLAFFIDQEVPIDYQELYGLAIATGHRDTAALLIAHGARVSPSEPTQPAPAAVARRESPTRVSTPSPVVVDGHIPEPKLESHDEEKKDERMCRLIPALIRCFNMYRIVLDPCKNCKGRKKE